MASARSAGTHGRSTRGAAAITGPAARRLRFSEVPPKEYASAFLGMSIIGDGPDPPLALVAKCLEPCDEIVGAGFEDVDWRHNDAPLLIALYETGLLKIRQQRLANP
jgi:hypothetical protein